MPTLSEVLFLVHTLIETVLGAVKLRGKYSKLALPDGAERYVRHHGVSLLGLALLGFLVLYRRQVHAEAGAIAAIALAFFHAGALCAAYGGHGPPLLLMHGGMAIGFAVHAWRYHSGAGQRKK